MIRLPALARCVALVLFSLTFAQRSWGQAPAVLTVERKLGAEGCPDVDALTARVERIRGRPADHAKVSYQVTFARDEEAFSATIRSPDGTSVRTLADRRPTCTALAQATAVTLALLLDSDAEPAPPEPPTPAPTAPPPAPKPAAAPPPPAPEASPQRPTRYATLIVGSGGMTGVFRPIAFALSGEIAVSISRWHIGAGVMGSPPQDIKLGPGAVHEGLIGPFLRLCFAPVHGGSIDVDVCSGGYVGFLSAEGRNFTSNAKQSGKWIGLPFELAATYMPGPIGLQASAELLFPLLRQNFSIDNLGVAYEAKPVAFMFCLRAIARVNW